MKTLLFVRVILLMGCAAKEPGYDYSKEADAWLRFHPKPTNMADAKIRCQREGGVLATPASAAVALEMLATMAEHQLMRSVFTGIKSLVSSENIKIDGGLAISSVPLIWTAAGDAEKCLALTGAGVLDQASCASKFPYFCSQDNATITRNLCGNVAGYTLEVRFGSCYKFHRTPRTWYEAYLKCHGDGAELAVINSDDEAAVLRGMFEDRSSDQAIVGFSFKINEWVTVEEQSLEEAGYNSWAPGEPNNKNGDEGCGFMLRSGLLNDDPCDKQAPSICEISI